MVSLTTFDRACNLLASVPDALKSDPKYTGMVSTALEEFHKNDSHIVIASMPDLKNQPVVLKNTYQPGMAFVTGLQGLSDPNSTEEHILIYPAIVYDPEHFGIAHYGEPLLTSLASDGRYNLYAPKEGPFAYHLRQAAIREAADALAVMGNFLQKIKDDKFKKLNCSLSTWITYNQHDRAGNFTPADPDLYSAFTDALCDAYAILPRFQG